jgi:hypothetical protein
MIDFRAKIQKSAVRSFLPINYARLFFFVFYKSQINAMKKFLSLLALVSAHTAFAQFGSEPIKGYRYAENKTAEQRYDHPDGSKVAFVVNSIEPDGDTKWEYKYFNQIYIAPVDGSSAPRALTTKEECIATRLEPGWKTTSFCRTVDSKSQIFVVIRWRRPCTVNQIQIRRFFA